MWLSQASPGGVHACVPSVGVWSGWPRPPTSGLHHPGTEPASLTSPALAGGFFTPSVTNQILNFSHFKSEKPQSSKGKWESLESQSLVLTRVTAPQRLLTLWEGPLRGGGGLGQCQRDEVILAGPLFLTQTSFVCLLSGFVSTSQWGCVTYAIPQSPDVWGVSFFAIKKYTVGPKKAFSVFQTIFFGLKFLRINSQKWEDWLKKTEWYIRLFSVAPPIRPWALQLRGPGLPSCSRSLGLTLGKGHNFSELQLTLLKTPTLVHSIPLFLKNY